MDDSCPAQGAMLVVAMQNDDFTLDALHSNDIETEIATYIERQFLKTLRRWLYRANWCFGTL
jgi:porphobilinogen deaminase